MNNLRHKQKYDAIEPPKKKISEKKDKLARWKQMGNTEKTDKNTKKN